MEEISIEELEQRIAGCLAGVLIGDAMGCATENMSKEEIIKRYGGRLTNFVDPPLDSPYSSGRKAGQITDDAGLFLEMIDATIENRGLLTLEKISEHLLKWAENTEMFERFAGPSTRRSIELLRSGFNPTKTGIPDRKSLISGASNGAAVKGMVAGLINPGNLDKAINDAILLSLPTHNTHIAFSGASAVACAVSISIYGADSLLSVINAAIYGAEKGEELGRQKSCIVPAPSVRERIVCALQIALTFKDIEHSCNKLVNVIGNGLHISEAVPLAFGLFLSAKGDPNESIISAINAGGDTDSIAAIAGGISGAYVGIKHFKRELVDFVEKVNNIDLRLKAKTILNNCNLGG
ncbi:MAG: ADP-ribosylglycohydrolase family protein [Thermotogae bacterium]|nr:ADP-ribosylglycohydrolase family protein [Thermotogota bacterium]